MKKDKRLIITISDKLHTNIKVASAKTGKSMNLLINESLKKDYLK